jgi:pyruvate,orthophosphate dikinase
MDPKGYIDINYGVNKEHYYWYKMKKWIYKFGNNKAEGNANMRDLLGGKGANLAEISSLGFPVPPGFTITTDACLDYYKCRKAINDDIRSQANLALIELGEVLELRFGDPKNPLLLSVRSGARASMPGMMDTILNVGLNDSTVIGLANLSGNEKFAYDSYRRLIEMYSDVVLKIDRRRFEDILNKYISNNYLYDERELDAEHLKSLIAEYKQFIVANGKQFPQDPLEQLWSSVSSVFESWMNDRAIRYRKINDIPEEWGTAVNIQSMVFGNFGDESATGVCFTRDPSTGDDKFYGEFMLNAQGEDVVAGIRTPQQITIEGKKANYLNSETLEEIMPEIYTELLSISKLLEKHFKDMQDIEFTIQNRKLWLLQTRSGKRSPSSAVKVAVSMVKEGLIKKHEAIMRVMPKDVENLLHPRIDTKGHDYKLICKGLPASPGAASGFICFTAHDAENKYKGQKVILVRAETSPEDIGGMHVAQGVITSRGGMTSHAAVVARGMGKPCIVGAGDFKINESTRTVEVEGKILREGDKISINGATGEIIKGEVRTILPELSPELEELLKWCDEIKDLKVRANADTKIDAATARKFGAEGIGLCRTEHMFFKPSRILSVRKMITATDKRERKQALDELFVYQKDDFKEILSAMNGFSVTIRLLDPPLHEFLPFYEAEISELAHALSCSIEEVKQRVNSLKEANPMLGHRGCRLAISNPEIYEMQIKAILEAAIEEKYTNSVEIMIPLVLSLTELNYCKALIEKVASELKAKHKDGVNYLVGTMIELPRAALKAGELAQEASFFSFGTNDLTQTTMGLSRDDAAAFMQDYLDKHIFDYDPFSTLDIDGVGEMVKIACERGRNANPKLKLGICGEHGGDPASIQFFHDTKLSYISCSPYRVPVARLAAARAKAKGL